jgi:Zn-dependent peptidase ImmA (M78 family)
VTANKHHALEAARAARLRLGVGLDAPVPDILRLIEDAGGVPVTVRPLGDGISGAYGRKRDRGFIFVSSNDAPVRRRFTLAHEYGHHCLNHRGVVDREEEISGRSRRPEEVEANYFASEFLAPTQAVRNWFDARAVDEITLRTVVELAHFFGISPPAARIRIEESGYRIMPAHRRQLDEQIANGEHLRLRDLLQLEDIPDSLSISRIEHAGVRAPALEFRRAARAYETGLTRPARIASYLGLDEDSLERQFAQLGIHPPEPDDEDDD